MICNHYSSWDKIRRIVAYLVKTKNSLKEHSRLLVHLSTPEIKVAETLILKHVQTNAYLADISRIKSGLHVLKSSPLRKLDPRMNAEGLLVVGGRLTHSHLHDINKHPIILPHDHPVSTLIIRSIPARCHLGREWILSLLRKRFWITKARSLVYKVSGGCVTCRRLFSRACTQKMADLPE